MFCALPFLIPVRQNVSLLASRQDDQFRKLQTSMTATLTELIRDQISVLPRWPGNIERVQRKIRIDSIGLTSARYQKWENGVGGQYVREQMHQVDNA